MRNFGLDVLRGIAVLLVIFRHGFVTDNLLGQFGWAGVDLFFVLSGYLISNSLFLEYKKHKTIDVKRFFVRRSFRIFPPFYIFVGSTICLYRYFDLVDFGFSKILTELFYLQSYLPGIWLHTWSLAVEEHFYLIFGLSMFFLPRGKVIENSRAVVIGLSFLLLAGLSLRIADSYPHRNDAYYHFMNTHLRSDGIIIGVLISYLLNFTHWLHKVSNYWGALVLIGLAMLIPGLVYEGGSFFMNTVGLTLLNIGFGLIMLAFLSNHVTTTNRSVLNRIAQVIAFVGVNSYSIYLYHLNVKLLVSSKTSFLPEVQMVLFVGLSLLVGVIMSYLVEKPILRFRDRRF